MGYEQILYSIEDRVATITLNRPDKLNAFTGTMGEEIYDAFRRSVEDDDVRAIIVTGAGRGFCAGVDLKALANSEEASKISGGNFIHRFPLENYACPKPTICAINGAAFGVGVTMAVSFDIRIAAEDAKLAVPFAKLGMLPGLGSSKLLPQLVGRGKALDLILTARTILGTEAHEIGLVDRVVPADQVLPTARELAATLAEYDPIVLEHCKRLVNESAELPLEAAMQNDGKISATMRAAREGG